MKSHKKRKIGIVVLGSIIIIIIVLAALIYCKHMNFWPFQGDKIAGLPDDHLKVADKKVEGPVSLLFASSGEILFNSKAKYISAYIDYYEKDKRKKHELIFETGMEKGGISGSFNWGTLSNADEGVLPKELRMNMASPNGSVSTGNFVFPKIKWDDTEGAASSFNAFSPVKIKLGKKYIVQTWRSDGRAYGEAADIFSKKALRHSNQTVIFYIVFK
ncbi:Uncharacterised protein [Listeria grayi]|uniref:Uncharacterized protein n=1 Tax=Listeria grayi FSL F6-1183 TaxID=1265827 RepID=A0A829R7M6_LISGR|nr:hypothetical protein [Listeria grayi]EUJ28551.1 hypothetical protein LMUR_05582 [Listeria grayi FSL F6-1183]VEI30487.1 Uncharacterised protein [Listeria grayi]